jgi:hypothetical protein
MLDFFSNINLFQLVLIGIGLFLIVPQFVDMFKKRFLNTPVDNSVSLSDPSHALTELVCKWECLCDACEELELKEACSKLEEVFPLLAGGRRHPSPKKPVVNGG